MGGGKMRAWHKELAAGGDNVARGEMERIERAETRMRDELARANVVVCRCRRWKERGVMMVDTHGCSIHSSAAIAAKLSATTHSPAMGSGSSPEHPAGGLGDFVKGLFGQTPPPGRLFEVALAAGEARFTLTGFGLALQLDEVTAIALRGVIEHGIRHCQKIHLAERGAAK